LVSFFGSLLINQRRSGEKLVNFLIEPTKGTKWPSKLPKIGSRPEAIAICKELCKLQFIHRSEKAGKGELEVGFQNKMLYVYFSIDSPPSLTGFTLVHSSQLSLGFSHP